MLGAALLCFTTLAPANTSAAQAVAPVPARLGSAIIEHDRIDEVLKLRQIAQRVATIRWQLARGNIAICRRTISSFGMSLHETSQYPSRLRAAATQAFNMQPGLPSIWTTVPDGPADWAGLRVGDVIIAIDGNKLSAVPETAASNMQQAIEALERKSAGHETEITVARAGVAMTFIVAAELTCADTFETSAANDIARPVGDAQGLAWQDPALDDRELVEKTLLGAARKIIDSSQRAKFVSRVHGAPLRIGAGRIYEIDNEVARLARWMGWSYAPSLEQAQRLNMPFVSEQTSWLLRRNRPINSQQLAFNDASWWERFCKSGSRPITGNPKC